MPYFIKRRLKDHMHSKYIFLEAHIENSQNAASSPTFKSLFC